MLQYGCAWKTLFQINQSKKDKYCAMPLNVSEINLSKKKTGQWLPGNMERIEGEKNGEFLFNECKITTLISYRHLLYNIVPEVSMVLCT